MYNKRITIYLSDGGILKFKDCEEIGETVDSSTYLYEMQKTGLLIKSEDIVRFFPWNNIFYIEIERYGDE